MRGRLWFHIPKRNYEFVLVNNRGLDFAGDDFLKKGFAHVINNFVVAPMFRQQKPTTRTQLRRASCQRAVLGFQISKFETMEALPRRLQLTFLII